MIHTWGFVRIIAAGGVHRNAHVAQGKLVTFKHFRPREPKRLHDRGTTVPDSLAQPAARIYGSFEAHRGEERAEEYLRAGVTGFVHQRNPAARLLLHLRDGFMLQQIGKQHLLVAHIKTQPQVFGDFHALWGFAVTVRPRLRSPGVLVLILGSVEQREEDSWSDEDPQLGEKILHGTRGKHNSYIQLRCTVETSKVWICISNALIGFCDVLVLHSLDARVSRAAVPLRSARVMNALERWTTNSNATGLA